MATETVTGTLADRGVETGLDPDALAPAIEMTNEIRAKYAYA